MINGSVNNYVQQQNLWQKAEAKLKQNPPDSDGQKISQLVTQMNEAGDKNRLAAIMTKMRCGKRLTGAEKDYLRKSSPDMYRKYQQIEAERSGYRKQLKSAKTKAEAAQIHQMKIAQLYGECNSITPTVDGDLAACREAAIREEYREHQARQKTGRDKRTIQRNATHGHE